MRGFVFVDREMQKVREDGFEMVIAENVEATEVGNEPWITIIKGLNIKRLDVSSIVIKSCPLLCERWSPDRLDTYTS